MFHSFKKYCNKVGFEKSHKIEPLSGFLAVSLCTEFESCSFYKTLNISKLTTNDLTLFRNYGHIYLQFVFGRYFCGFVLTFIKQFGNFSTQIKHSRLPPPTHF